MRLSLKSKSFAFLIYEGCVVRTSRKSSNMCLFLSNSPLGTNRGQANPHGNPILRVDTACSRAMETG